LFVFPSQTVSLFVQCGRGGLEGEDLGSITTAFILGDLDLSAQIIALTSEFVNNALKVLLLLL
jgi:hypothetical protein